MPLPVIADVYRLELNWVNLTGGPSVANVLHLKSTAAADAADVAAAFDAANSGLTGDPWDAMSDNYTMPVLGVIKLDGTSATVEHTMSHIPQGGATGDKIMQACAVMSIRTHQRGPRGRGRQYIGPIGEDKQHDGSIETASKTAMRTGWLEIFTALETGSPSCLPGVASYTHADFNELSQFFIDDKCGTQRRRMDAVR